MIPGPPFGRFRLAVRPGCAGRARTTLDGMVEQARATDRARATAPSRRAEQARAAEQPRTPDRTRTPDRPRGADRTRGGEPAPSPWDRPEAALARVVEVLRTPARRS